MQWFSFAGAALLPLMFGVTTARGQAPVAPAEPPAQAAEATLAPESAPAPVIDGEADRLLHEMSATLTKAVRFALEAEEIFEEIPDAGPRRSLTNARRIAIERPNRAISDVTGEAANRTVWFDGGRLTVLDKEAGAPGN